MGALRSDFREASVAGRGKSACPVTKYSTLTLLYIDDNGLRRDMFQNEFDRHPLSRRVELIVDSGLYWKDKLYVADTVVSDLKLPGTTGLRVIEEFRGQKPDGEAILFSSGGLPVGFPIPPGVIFLSAEAATPAQILNQLVLLLG